MYRCNVSLQCTANIDSSNRLSVEKLKYRKKDLSPTHTEVMCPHKNKIFTHTNSILPKYASLTLYTPTFPVCIAGFFTLISGASLIPILPSMPLSPLFSLY